uniref:Uncharacterized protein TCIL3000_10_1240 n=1 Tax=Trypanosoma congolense (strain IL3000) TaxID=1068625 RepID=G0UVF0_TRYCI|nr:unnamed protein product [Trypanosoma congolense IL3000]
MTQDEEIRTLRHQLWGYQKSVTRGFGSPQLPGDMHTPPDSASLKMSASAEKRLIEKLQGIVAEKTMLLEERELQFETLHAEINDAIVQAVQEVSPAELSTEAEGNEEQREILLKNITHDLLLHFGCLTPTARGLHADGALPASYDDASVTTATGSQSNVGGAGSVLFTDTPTVSNTREGSENSIHE